MSDLAEHPRLVLQVGARSGPAYNFEGELVMLRRRLAGHVDVPSGELALCDPGVAEADLVGVRVPPGSYAVYVSSWSPEFVEGVVNAAVEIRLAEVGDIDFHPLTAEATTPPSDDPDDPEDAGLHFVGVDGSSLYLVDRTALTGHSDASSFRAAADDQPAQQLTLPHSSVRLVRVASGFGTGGYPVFGGYDAGGQLAAVYASFDLAFEQRPESEDDDDDDYDTGSLPLIGSS